MTKRKTRTRRMLYDGLGFPVGYAGHKRKSRKRPKCAECGKTEAGGYHAHYGNDYDAGKHDFVNADKREAQKRYQQTLERDAAFGRAIIDAARKGWAVQVWYCGPRVWAARLTAGPCIITADGATPYSALAKALGQAKEAGEDTEGNLFLKSKARGERMKEAGK
jgi:hypothetical protein